MTTVNRRVEENERIARRVPEKLATEGDLDLVDDLFAEDAVEHGPFGDDAGRPAIRESMAQFLSAFSDFSATVEDSVAAEDTVAMRVTLRGTHDGEFMGAEPTGRTFEIENMVFTRIEDGKIAERWLQPDVLGLVRQLDLEPSPGWGR